MGEATAATEETVVTTATEEAVVTAETEVAASEEAEVAAEMEAEKEEAVSPPKKPSGPNAQVAILSKLEAKEENELTQVEKDIMAAKARSAKFGKKASESFHISDELKRRLRAERFGLSPASKRQKTEK